MCFCEMGAGEDQKAVNIRHQNSQTKTKRLIIPTRNKRSEVKTTMTYIAMVLMSYYHYVIQLARVVSM